jgi:hypothetical protein
MGENFKPVRPWDLFNKNMNRAPANIQQERLAICQSCPFYRKKINQCKKCGCIMPQKVKLADASCPVGKWGQHISDINKVSFKENWSPEDDS